MKHLPFPALFEKSKCVLGEGAVIERLRRNGEFELDPHIVNSGFIYDPGKRAAISGIYRQYIPAGLAHCIGLDVHDPFPQDLAQK